VAVDSLTRAPFPLTVPRFVSGLISFSSGETPGYAQVCILPLSPRRTFVRRLWTRQRPRFSRFPVRSVRIGPDGRLSISNSRRGLRLRKAGFPFTGPGVIIYQLIARIDSDERLGEFRSTHTPACGLSRWSRPRFRWARQDPQVYRHLDRFPRSWTTLAPSQDSSSCYCRPPAQSLEPSFLFAAPAFTTGSSRRSLGRNSGRALVCTLPLSVAAIEPSLVQSQLRM